jgi:hypothetical protein
MTNWINKLTLEQEKALNLVISEKVDKKLYSITSALDASISAALYELTDLSVKEVEEIISRSSDYMKDCEEFLIKYKEDWIMKLNEIKSDIKKECLKLLNKNISGQNEAVKELKIKFNDIPNKDLANTFKEAKEEWCLPKEMKEKTETKNQPISEQEQSNNVITHKEEKKSNTEEIDRHNMGTKNMFEMLEKKLKFKGNYYQYEKDKNGLKAGGEFFKNLEEFEVFRLKEIEDFEKMCEEIRAAFAYEG